MTDNVIRLPHRPGQIPLTILERRNTGYVPDDPDELRSWYIKTRQMFDREFDENRELRKELHRVRLSRAYWHRKAGQLKETG